MAAPLGESVRLPPRASASRTLTVIPPKICEKERRAPRRGVKAPTSTIPSETAGLKRPPEILKKIQALTARENPKDSAMYSLHNCQYGQVLQRLRHRTHSQVGGVDYSNCFTVLSSGGVSRDGIVWDESNTTGHRPQIQVIGACQ